MRQTALFEIKRKSGLDDESDVDLQRGRGRRPYQVASAAGLARLAPNGLLKQNESVDVACLKPSLVRVLKTVEGHYGRKMVVTSGYRSPAHNRRANGAKNSLHMYCAAADIQVPGVSKWELANYIRTMPGRGGVGTYCHTNPSISTSARSATGTGAAAAQRRLVFAGQRISAEHVSEDRQARTATRSAKSQICTV